MWRDLERAVPARVCRCARPSRFPRSGLLAARVALAAAGEPWLPEFVRAVYHANFAEDRNIDRSRRRRRTPRRRRPARRRDVARGESEMAKEGCGRRRRTRSGSASSARPASSSPTSCSGATIGWRTRLTGAPAMSAKPARRPAAGRRSCAPVLPHGSPRFATGWSPLRGDRSGSGRGPRQRAPARFQRRALGAARRRRRRHVDAARPGPREGGRQRLHRRR